VQFLDLAVRGRRQSGLFVGDPSSCLLAQLELLSSLLRVFLFFLGRSVSGVRISRGLLGEGLPELVQEQVSVRGQDCRFVVPGGIQALVPQVLLRTWTIALNLVLVFARDLGPFGRLAGSLESLV
jgi:hypothetical protein